MNLAKGIKWLFNRWADMRQGLPHFVATPLYEYQTENGGNYLVRWAIDLESIGDGGHGYQPSFEVFKPESLAGQGYIRPVTSIGRQSYFMPEKALTILCDLNRKLAEGHKLPVAEIQDPRLDHLDDMIASGRLSRPENMNVGLFDFPALGAFLNPFDDRSERNLIGVDELIGRSEAINRKMDKIEKRGLDGLGLLS